MAVERKKAERIPPAWEKLTKIGAARLVKAEATSLLALRTQARMVHHELLGTIQAAGSRAASLAALKHARATMAQTIAAEVKATRTRAREAALVHAQSELDQLAIELRKLGYITSGTRFNPGEVTDHEADDAAADAVGSSLSAAWAQAVLAFIINATSDEDVDVAKQARMVMAKLDYRLARIAATEAARAFSDQHEDATSDPEEWDLDEPERDRSRWIGWVFRYWSAVLDRRTCEVCRDHDGEITPLGLEFKDGDEPGDVHVLCRCTDGIVFLPVPIGEDGEPEEDEYPERDDQVEAA